MPLNDYIDVNARYYSRKARDAVDDFSITMFSARQYDRRPVPTWNVRRAEAVRDSNSLWSLLLKANDDAVEEAQRILQGSFRLFDAETKGESMFPDWHKDYLSGRTYPLHPYTRYKIIENTGADIIVPWELSRLQFIPSLIRAYRVTKDPKYQAHFFKAISHWQNANPFLFGVNWMCGLDVAIRALNLALGIIYFDETDETLRGPVLRLLWAHLLYLQKRDLYLRKSTVNNHQLVAALLHYALLHLFDARATRHWRAKAYEIVRREVERQFHPDGGNFESALLYHQFVLEAMFASLAMLAGSDALSCLADHALLPQVFGERLKSATQFVADYSRAWSAVPLLGDSSDGRIVFFRDYFSWTPDDPTYIADWSALVFPADNSFLAPRSGGARTDIRTKSGLGMFSSSRYSAIFCAMPVSPGAAGHNHLDKASVLLRVRESPILVDSGTFCYTSDLAARHYFRAGRAHNVLLIDGEDQALLGGSGAFETPLFKDMGIELLPGNQDGPVFRMWHDGYSRVPGLGMVTRSVYCLPDGLRILDAIEGTGRVRVELVFNLHPRLSIAVANEGVNVRLNSQDLCTVRPGSGWAVSLESGSYSARYGIRQTNVRLVLSAAVALPFEAITEISILGQLS